ncbi:MAG: hypothetical protein H3C62_09175 [Gemmatimonadaceae bacterium]|nr:hypothetical protein [Gemmatimonadaceae bacterium]
MSLQYDTETFLAAVQDRLPLVEVVAGVVPLRRSGRSYRGPCPFHQGTNPNFDVSPSRHLAYCFTCGWGGDLVRFIREHPAFPVRTFGEALRYLSERTGVALPPMRGLDAEAEARAAAARQADDDAMRYAYRFFRAARAAEKFAAPVAECLDRCCLTAEAAERVGAGFAPPGGNALVAAISKHDLAGNLWEALRRLGLLAFDGEAGTADATATVHDAVAPGLVLPVVGAPDWNSAGPEIGPYERLFGFVRWDADGRLQPLTQSCGPLHIPRGALRMRRTSPDASPTLALFSDAEAWRTSGDAWAGDAVIPAAPWETPAAIQRISQLTRMRPSFGMLAGAGSPVFWLHPQRMMLVDGVLAPDQPPSAAIHACEAALREDAGLDLTDPIRAVADERLRLVLEGWWRECHA